MNVTVRNIIASGTHGVSVSCSSSVGGNYLLENAVIYNSLMGARFKGVLGTTYNLSDITWRNFEIRNTSYPIHFTETCLDQEKPPTGPTAAIAAYTKDFSWVNIRGSSVAVMVMGVASVILAGMQVLDRSRRRRCICFALIMPIVRTFIYRV